MGNQRGSGYDARRLRKRRLLWGGADYARRKWTPQDEASLLLHVELLGYAWSVLARSMRRSPDAIRNKLLRMMQEHQEAERLQARRDLQLLVRKLRLQKPKEWGRKPPVLRLPPVPTYRKKPEGRTVSAKLTPSAAAG